MFLQTSLELSQILIRTVPFKDLIRRKFLACLNVYAIAFNLIGAISITFPNETIERRLKVRSSRRYGFEYLQANELLILWLMYTNLLKPNQFNIKPSSMGFVACGETLKQSISEILFL